jgi:hypothetical protein
VRRFSWNAELAHERVLEELPSGNFLPLKDSYTDLNVGGESAARASAAAVCSSLIGATISRPRSDIAIFSDL